MGPTDTQESGIYAWMASVRASMDNDPCRQLFEDQVQTHALIFLDDYLEHIVTGPKQAPIIELVKTPGRKKNLPRKTRAATAAAAKARDATLLSLDCDDSTRDTVPVNNFHRALLQAKEATRDTLDAKAQTEPLVTPNGSADNTHGRTGSVRVVDIPQITVSVEPKAHAGTRPFQQYSQNTSKDSSTHFTIPERGTELSVIAEGDESPERVHPKVHPLSSIASHQGSPSDAVPRHSNQLRRHSVTERNPEIIAVDNNYSGYPASGRDSVPFHIDDDAHHSIPFDSPGEVQSSGIDARHHTEPLPPRTDISSSRNTERNAFTAPLPIVPASNSVQIPNTMSVPLNDSSPRTSAPKGSTTGFSMLPAPSPLRKSVRIPQEIPTGVALPTPAPALAPLGKRTSWLMKAREAKAMEGTTSLPGTTAAATSAAFPRVSTAVKRKSGEMLGALPLGPDGDNDQRKSKVAKSIEVSVVTSDPKETEKGGQRGFPLVHGELVAPASVVATLPVDRPEPRTTGVDEQTTRVDPAEDGFIDLFKRTVEGLGARVGKSMDKSLGGAAVAALAEARAAAEAKVAERNKVGSDSEILHDDGLLEQEPLANRSNSDDHIPDVIAPRAKGAERRLSLSDLASDSVQPTKSERSAKTIQAMDAGAQANRCDESISTTPPDSPPSKGSSGFVKPAGPVFNKPPPPPVFMPLASKESSSSSVYPKESSSLNFPPGQFTLPVAVPLGIPARLPSPADGLLSLVQTSQTAVQPSQSNPSSEPTFGNRDGIPAWTASAQDTVKSQSRDNQYTTIDDDDDDDDSWPLEEKLAAVEPGWRPFDFSNVDKEDTWSSLPTESQGPTRSLPAEHNGDAAEAEANDEEVEHEQEIVEISDTEHSVMEVDELEEAAESGMAGLRLVEPIPRSTSQASTASTASSVQAQAGFFNQATKLVNSMLGGGKKAKPELKSLQLAAAAARKQQEEADKKMQRQKDMEARRQAALAKKTEERTRLLEEERKSKEDFEKRKREREENTDRRPLKLPLSTKAEDDASKKRRLAPETKKSETKKPPSKDRKDLAPPTRGVITPATKFATQKGAKIATVLVSSTAYNTTQNAPAAPSAKPIVPEAKPFKVVHSSLKGKTKAKLHDDDIGDKLPSTMVQSQMAARAKAQMQAAKLPTLEVPSESIELPEINSEYSDSGDEGRVRTFDPPDWAQSPELRQALQMQSTMNPDDIFGAIRPLRMEEMFRTRQSRFRARTSSANWSGSDRLTIEEIREYERRMGFQ